jgi:hypothetical protein
VAGSARSPARHRAVRGADGMQVEVQQPVLCCVLLGCWIGCGEGPGVLADQVVHAIPGLMSHDRPTPRSSPGGPHGCTGELPMQLAHLSSRNIASSAFAGRTLRHLTATAKPASHARRGMGGWPPSGYGQPLGGFEVCPPALAPIRSAHDGTRLGSSQQYRGAGYQGADGGRIYRSQPALSDPSPGTEETARRRTKGSEVAARSSSAAGFVARLDQRAALAGDKPAP